MMDLCWPVSAIEGRSYIRSAMREQLDVPRPKLSTYNGKKAVSYAGQSAWNSLPNYLKDSSLTLVMFNGPLNTFLFQSIIECCQNASDSIDAFSPFSDGVTSRPSLCGPILGYTSPLVLPSIATDSGLQTPGVCLPLLQYSMLLC